MDPLTSVTIERIIHRHAQGNLIWAIPQFSLFSQMTLACVKLTAEVKVGWTGSREKMKDNEVMGTALREQMLYQCRAQKS